MLRYNKACFFLIALLFLLRLCLKRDASGKKARVTKKPPNFSKLIKNVEEK